MEQIQKNEFLKATQIVKETSAILNYFRFYGLALITKATYRHFADINHIFYFLGGGEFFQRLVLDCKEENIDIFSNTVQDLNNKLKENLSIMKQITFPKGTMENEMIAMGNNFEKYSSTIQFVNKSAYSELLHNCSFLVDYTELEQFQPKQKKIGEKTDGK